MNNPEPTGPNPGLTRQETADQSNPDPLPDHKTPDHKKTNQQTTAEFFDQLGDQYDLAISQCVPRYHEMLDQMLEFVVTQKPIARILELGCGSGNLTQKLLDQYPSTEIVAVDASSKMVSIARKRFQRQSSLNFREALFQELQFDPDSFDLVTSSISIHHLQDPEKLNLFRKIRQWLRPHGWFSFCDQFRGETEELYRLHIQFWKNKSLDMGATQSDWDTWMEHQKVHDFHSSMQKHFDLLTKAGFESVDCTRRFLLWTTLVASGQSKEPLPG